MLGKDATNWIVKEKNLLIELNPENKIADVKHLRHVTCFDYDLQSLLEAFLKDWTHREINYTLPEEVKGY